MVGNWSFDERKEIKWTMVCSTVGINDSGRTRLELVELGRSVEGVDSVVTMTMMGVSVKNW